MPSGKLEWVVVSSWNNRDIGAVGFLGPNAVVIVSFYDDFDGDLDGEVGIVEYAVGSLFGLENAAVARVAEAARHEPVIYERDGSFRREAASILVDFGRSLATEAVFHVYLERGVRSLSKRIAGMLTKSRVKQYVIRKGMERAAKEAFRTAAGS